MLSKIDFLTQVKYIKLIHFCIKNLIKCKNATLLLALYYRIINVLTDANCVKDDKVGPNQQIGDYQPPGMTCIPFDITPGFLAVSFPQRHRISKKNLKFIP
jgi:hypothetical protein